MRWLIVLLALSSFSTSVLGNAVTLIDAGPFDQRLSEARKTTGKFWIGWSVQRWADPQQFGQTGRSHWNGHWNGSWNGSFRHGRTQFSGRPLHLLVATPKISEPSLIPPSNSSWERRPLAILLTIHDGKVQQVLTSDFSLPINLDQNTLKWLGTTTADQSVAALEDIQASQDRYDLHRAITQAVGRHQGQQALAMLQRQLAGASKRHPDIRRDAAEGLGFQQGPGVIGLLRQLILSDAQQRVRQAALSALRWQPIADSGQLLQDLASGSLENSVQANALRLLAQRQPDAAKDTLNTVIWSPQHVHIRAAAAKAVSLLPANVALPLATRAATAHPEAHVRASAVEALARLKAPESLGILRQIVSTDDEYKVQETALEALVDLPRFVGLSAIAKVAHTHPNKRLRAEAIEALGNMGQAHPPARQALMTLIDV